MPFSNSVGDQSALRHNLARSVAGHSPICEFLGDDCFSPRLSLRPVVNALRQQLSFLDRRRFVSGRPSLCVPTDTFKEPCEIQKRFGRVRIKLAGQPQFNGSFVEPTLPDEHESQIVVQFWKPPVQPDGVAKGQFRKFEGSIGDLLQALEVQVPSRKRVGCS